MKTLGGGNAWVAIFAGLLAIAISGSVRADPIFKVGSTFTLIGTNFPNDFTQTVTLNPGTTLIDGGILSLTQSIVDQNGGEWLVLDFQTTDGGDIAGSQNAHWEIDENNVHLVKSSIWTQRYFDWGTDGVLANPTSLITPEPGLAIATNPITGSGDVFLRTITVGPFKFLDYGVFLTPFSSLGKSGIDPTDVNEFQNGLFVSPVPEPRSLALLASALAGLGFFVRRARRRHT
jgi:hypothetical protein